ncbi:extracellular solute-binding protein [Spartinivicinus poritis]|uniref:Extracellular solute-binding protein n=1 Tax=Spartinivicinus poritis TaxID=2994640 RepID=A0ABT5UF97_9GAMM|nr:extracellular solute-binding protein [Spartinivicinus sp. A2-2]MDE1464143.1 extracellular solute-binding protein [Spartinivicinus sp. A2-2]
MLIKLVCYLSIVISPFISLSLAYASDSTTTKLRVALYPYVPNRLALFQKIEAIFESRNPNINLELVDNSTWLWDYYSGGLQATKADVYEVDTILLSDLIEAGKIAEVKLPSAPFTKEAIEAVTRNGKVYGVPHWLCGNFLFYKKDDKEVKNASTWSELNNVLNSRNESILVDFKGQSTLGEWYLTALSATYGLGKSQQIIMDANKLDQQGVDKLKQILKSCPPGYCRNDDLHDRAGYYSRAFMSGKASAYVGYSESIHYGIQYYMNNCTSTSGCLSVDNIAVRSLPSFSGSTAIEGVGWVDALTIDASIPPHKKAIAKKFIAFMISDTAYKTVLEPEWGEAPKYLIPAKKGVQLDKTPLYSAFYSAHSSRKTGTLPGLNNKLRQLGKKLDCALPIDRTDTETLEKCSY